MSGQAGTSKTKDVAQKRGSSDTEDKDPRQVIPKVRPQHPEKRRRHERHHSSSSDSAILDVNKISKAMDRLLLHPGKLRVFQAFFDDPRVEFLVRPERRRRHPAGSGRQAPVEDDPLAHVRERQPVPVLNQAGAIVGYKERDTGEPALGPVYDAEHSIHSAETAPISQVYEGDFSLEASSRSSRGFSAGSFASFHSGLEPDPEPEMVPFGGLDSPPKGVSETEPRVKFRRPKLGLSSSEGCSTAGLDSRPCSDSSVRISMSSVELDAYMASRSATDSEEEPVQPMPDLAVVLDRGVDRISGDGNIPSSKSMSESSEHSAP